VQGGGVTIGKLQLWRDNYWTQLMREGEAARDNYPVGLDFSEPVSWEELRHSTPMTMYVQPGHYLSLGDNSPHSSDSRMWGLVPRRLLIGRVLLEPPP
jgi:hypothetical protein